MKIISWNTNGLRAIHKKGFLSWLRAEDPDILCLQETKASEEDLPEELLAPAGYHAFFNTAEKKGYSGVGIYSKFLPETAGYALGYDAFDREGRMIELSFPSFTLVNVYMPNGGQMKERMPHKLQSYDALISHLQDKKERPLVLAGDLNIAHTEQDLARPKENKNSTMFTPAEREKFEELLQTGFVDIFRAMHPEGGHYTWWPYFAHARERNLGWRIDHILVSKSMRPLVTDASILSSVTGSDHCPVQIVCKIDLPLLAEAEARLGQNDRRSSFAEAL